MHKKKLLQFSVQLNRTMTDSLKETDFHIANLREHTYLHTPHHFHGKNGTQLRFYCL